MNQSETSRSILFDVSVFFGANVLVGIGVSIVGDELLAVFERGESSGVAVPSIGQSLFLEAAPFLRPNPIRLAARPIVRTSSASGLLAMTFRIVGDPSHLHTAFNELRTEARISPPPGQILHAAITTGGGAATGHIEDLSMNGAAFVADVSADLSLAGAARGSLRIDLPAEDLVEVPIVIRQRRLRPDGRVLYGCRFGDDGSGHGVPLPLVDYVLRARRGAL